MITYKMINDAQEQLISRWGEAGQTVIEEAAKVVPFNGNSKDFLGHCIARGNNWNGMLLTGIHKLYPTVWEAIPDDMGVNPFDSICSVLVLCGVDISE